MATLLETASLVMVPSGYEDGALGSLVPTDASGDFAFTRGSNLSATRVNEQGLIEKGYENLLSQSNNFNTSPWTTAGTLTPNQTGYDGSTNAWLYEKSAAFQQVGQLISKSGVLTFSVYLKAGSYEWVRLRISNLENAYYHLTGDGSLGSVAGGGVISAKIDSVGNEWYRCSISVNSTISDVKIYPALGNNDMGTIGTIYIQDAMLNQGLVAYPYIETTAAPEKGGVLANLPRLDYSSGRASVLLEPQRTNLITSSEYFVFQNGTQEYNSTISPEGFVNAIKIIEDSTLNGHRIFYNNIIPQNVSSVNYTFGGFFKVNTDSPSVRNEIQIQFFADSAVYSSSAFDISNGTTTGDKTTHRIDNYDNGWYRCSFTASVLQSTNTFSFARVNMGGGGSFFYEGDGVSSMFVYGLQLEQNATYPTSYIPTYDTTQTRSRDVCVNAGNDSTFNSLEGVLYAEISALTEGGDNRIIRLSDGGGNTNSIELRYAPDGHLYYDVWVSGASQFSGYYTSFTQKNTNKIALKWKANDFALWLNGTEIATDLNGSTFPANTLNNLSFSRGSQFYFDGNVKQVLTFRTALSYEACAELTTP